jgi:copper transport protein
VARVVRSGGVRRLARVTLPRALATVLLALLLLGLAAAPASAHAILTGSSPADGATLSTAPESLTLTFDEEVLARAATVTLRAGSGELLGGTGSARGALVVVGPEEATAVTVRLPALARGTYAVTWQVQSADDLHTTTGTVVFGIGDVVAPSGVDRTDPVPAPGASALRWLELLALAVLAGATLVGAIVLPRADLEPLPRRGLDEAVRRIARWAAFGAATASIAVLLDAADGPSHLGTVLSGSTFGRLWLGHEVVLVTATLLCWPIHRPSRSWLRTAAVAVALGSALATWAGASHVGVGIGRPLALLLLVLHLAAGTAWAGSVLVLGALVSGRGPHRSILLTRPLLRAFGGPAMVCVAAVVVTGTALTGRQVASVDALLTTIFGRILVAKVLLVAVAGLLGLRTMLRLRRVSATVGSLGHGVRVEALALILVLGAAATLSVGTPARGPAFAPTVQTQQAKLAAQVSDLFETLDLAPNRVGESWLRVTVDQTRRPEPAPIEGVSVRLTDPNQHQAPERSLRASEIAHHWELSGVDLSTAGTWHLRLAVHRRGRPDVVWDTDWTVGGGPLGSRPPMISDQPWSSVLDGIAVGLAAGTILVALAAGRRRRRPDEPDDAPETPVVAESTRLARV